MINLGRYNPYSELLIGEVMTIEGYHIVISLYPDKYRDVELASPLYISTGDCGIFALAISNITRSKYGKEFTLFRRRVGREVERIYPDLKTHYNYIVESLNIYYIDINGRVLRRRGCNPSPHDEVYLMHRDDFKDILSLNGFNSDIIRILAEDSPDPVLMREFLYKIKEALEEYDLNELISKLLDSLYTAGYRRLDLFIRDFREVFLDET